MASLNDKIVERLDLLDSMSDIDVLQKKDVIYSREYATTPDMQCPTCDKFLLTDYPRFCSDCGTRLHYRNNEEDLDY